MGCSVADWDRKLCTSGGRDVLQQSGTGCFLAVHVTDGVEGVCVDPGEMGTILEAGEVGGPGPPGGGKGGQLVSDSGGG
jgi:hypothetical protein